MQRKGRFSSFEYKFLQTALTIIQGWEAIPPSQLAGMYRGIDAGILRQSSLGAMLFQHWSIGYPCVMNARAYRWSQVEQDQPIPLLTRQRIHGANILAAKVHLGTGCHVALHNHPSEQLAIVLSGRVRWTIGEEGSNQDTVEMGGGEVLLIPSNVWHSVDALEDTEIVDILSPPGAMGVDSQNS
jgi:quercetin dioxygenase-like cupin family protein